MNIYAVIIGIAIAAFVALRFRARGLEKTKWAYPVLLATFPVYYWVFAVSAADYAALSNELIVGVAFLSIAYIAYRSKSFTTLLLLAIGYVAHAVYDAYHDALFINAGTPVWWPEFCGAVDGLLGIYIAYLAFSLRKQVAAF